MLVVQRPIKNNANKTSMLMASHDKLWLHIIFTFFFCCCILVLLIFRHKIIHVALSFCEFHFVHALTCIPMEEGFPAEHSREVLRYALKHFLNCGAVSSKSHSHLEAFWWDITNRRFDV